MILGPDDVMALVLAAVPSFEPEWRARVEAENAADEPGEYRLHYADIGEVLAHVSAQPAGRLLPLLAVVELLVTDGDPYVRELATVGYLEDLQSWARDGRLVEAEVLAGLGPVSRDLWDELDRFWGTV